MTTKQLFLAESHIVYKDSRDGDPHRTITRIVVAANDFAAIDLMEEHVRTHKLLRDDETVDLTYAHEAIGL